MTQCKKCKNNFKEEIPSFEYEDDKEIITHFLSKKSKNSDEEYELKKVENNYYNIYPEPDLNFGSESDSEGKAKPFKVVDEIEIEDVKEKLEMVDIGEYFSKFTVDEVVEVIVE